LFRSLPVGLYRRILLEPSNILRGNGRHGSPFSRTGFLPSVLQDCLIQDVACTLFMVANFFQEHTGFLYICKILINDDKILGTLDLVKETLEVTIPYEKFSVCEKVKRTTYSVLSPLTNMASGFERKEVHSVKLAVNESQISNLKFPEIEPIQVGDIVEVVGK
jgi:hypothetical protein